MGLATKSPRLPDFIGIGGMRCGTTWLHQMLALHPDVFVPAKKELHYWSRGILERDLDWYTEQFAGASERRLCGEISPSYSALKPAVIETVHTIAPAARLVLQIRNPVERAWSHFLLEQQRWSNRRRQERVPLAAALRHFESPRSLRRSDYETTIRRWRAAYGEAALQVVMFDRLAGDPSGLLAAVLEHIGADAGWQAPQDLLERPAWATHRIEMPPLVGWYLARQWLEPVRRLNDYLSGAVGAWVEQLSDLSADARPTRRLLRAANRFVLSMPERLVYRCYDAVRDRRLARRCAKVCAKHHSPVASEP